MLTQKIITAMFAIAIFFAGNQNIFSKINSTGIMESNIRAAAAVETQKEQNNLDDYYSSKRLGSFIEAGKTIFRIFSPNAEKVILATFNQPEDNIGKEFEMTRSDDGVWEIILDGELRGLYYGYKVFHEGQNLNQPNKEISIDPYAKSVASYTTYMNPSRAMVYDEAYDWEGDEWIQRDWRDLITYEMHVRDMTAHSSSGADKPGTYTGLIQKGIKGGIDYIKDLGVNTVELLPSMEFGTVEIPFQDSLGGKFNTWNYYERNHWGYMTSAFFAPEAYYSEGGDSLGWNKWIGKSGNQVKEFKDMVKAFHKEGIAVIMDVVYNHLSEYEIGNLKQIDKEYYFRLDDNGNYIAESYCGNDIKTERPMMRRLIIDSIIFWMKEYHVDGFRFDLAKLLDWETIEEIIVEAKKVNPEVVIVCEPWGGGYDPTGFSERGWGAWNDQIRNGIKGENPNNGHGWIFGKWYSNNSPERIKSYVNGTLTSDSLGLFLKKEHSVNYLAAHDGYTFGDFIRIGTAEVNPEKIIKNVDEHIKLTPKQLKLNKLGALFLFTSQGMTMIHSGQEFARTKVIPYDLPVLDPHKGMIDHNSYDKDNETNYINYNHPDINKELRDYYKGLIKLRKEFDAFRRAKYEDISFIDFEENEFSLAYILNYGDDHFFVAFNADPESSQIVKLPEGKWNVLVNGENAGIESLGKIKNEIVLESSTGMVLKKIN